MRTTRDRIRHAICFEVIGLFAFTIFGMVVFGHSVDEMGVLAIVGATMAMAWNYLYNLAFDHAKLRLTGTVAKTVRVRVLHSILFELSLMLVLLPFIMWYLGLGPIEAIVLDAGYAMFFVCYAFVFNWGYDIVFPIPGQRKRGQSGINAQ